MEIAGIHIQAARLRTQCIFRGEFKNIAFLDFMVRESTTTYDVFPYYYYYYGGMHDRFLQ